MNTAIIVAAGTGSRFGSTTPKQFLTIAGKPLLIHTLEEFESTTAIDEIIVVVSGDRIDQVWKLFVDHRISKLTSVIEGGANRSESVRNGFNAVRSSTDIVVVHDGARPLVDVSEIEECVEKAEEFGAACLVGKVTDTIKEVDGDFISGTIDRTKLRRALTPQAFRYDLLKRAFTNADLNDSVTDECCLVEKLGVKIAFVEGSSRNIKITTPDDLVFAAALLKPPA